METAIMIFSSRSSTILAGKITEIYFSENRRFARDFTI